MTNIHTDLEKHESDDVTDRIEAEMANVAQRYLNTMAMVFGIFYLIRGTAFLFLPGGVTGIYLALPCFVAVFVGLGLYFYTKFRQMPRWSIEGSFLLIATLLTFNISWVFVNGYNDELTPNIAFIMIAVGLGTISFWSWFGQLSVIVLGYVVLLVTIGSPDDKPFFFYLFSGAALSFLAFRARFTVVHERVALDVQLIRKARKLEAANRAKDRFLANMTHDLRTPMTGVLGMMDLLRDTHLSLEQKKLLKTAKTSAGYLLAIINDILDYSKLESGKFELKPAPMDAVAITHDVIEMLRAQAIKKEISLELKLPDEKVIAVCGDGVRVGQILFNLVGNAIKFTEKGGVSVSMHCPTNAGGFALEWVVTDTGAGIPQERIHKLFERFEQIDSSSTRRQQSGTGLGLAIIRELVDLMGGSVKVASEVGKGTEFSFALPFERLCSQDIESEETPEIDMSAVPAGLRVLVAEDNLVNQALIGKLLEKEGWKIQIVNNGEAAVAAATKSDVPFDLVLMDVRMPVMDGLEATRIIKEKMKAPPPIIALTANTMKEDVERYLEAGMDGHVGKPINMDTLREKIHHVLEMSRVAGDAER